METYNSLIIKAAKMERKFIKFIKANPKASARELRERKIEIQNFADEIAEKFGIPSETVDEDIRYVERRM